MPYVLIIIIGALTLPDTPRRIDHVESIRFESQQACEAARSAVSESISNIINQPGQSKQSASNVQMLCQPVSP